jgi:LacI family transcriptional regulator, kdg operon repressor
MARSGSGTATRITIEDVAREAEVSIATVSRFMNGRAGAMSPTTRVRLQQVVDRLGYVPNSAAQSLKTGRTKLIGVVLAEIAHMYWSSMLAGIEESCQERGYSIVISSAGNSAEAQNRYVSMFLKQKVEGLLLNPASADPATLGRWARLACPVIMLDRTFSGLDFPLVAVDNVHGARLAVQHLVELGHRSIGFVTWPIDNLSNRQERLEGYLAAMRDAGIAQTASHIRFARESWDDGVRQTIDLFNGPDPPTAVFAANMELNLQVLAGLKQLGLRVPTNVSLVGFDDSPWDPLLEPPLTTVATPPFQLGKLAALLLCNAVDRGERLHRSEHRIKPELVVRDSVAAPATPLH